MYTNIHVPALSAADLIIFICLHLCTNIVNKSNLTEDTDIDNELTSSDIVITHVGESKHSTISTNSTIYKEEL
jgi:hypothetical protein